MVYTSLSCWSAPRPADQAEFERYYADVHIPYASRVPGALQLILTLTADGPEQPAPFYRTAELVFATRADFEAATRTAEWIAMARDCEHVLERFGLTVLSGAGTPVDVPLAPGGPLPGTLAATGER